MTVKRTYPLGSMMKSKCLRPISPFWNSAGSRSPRVHPEMMPWKLIAANDYDLVLLDEMMPGKNGCRLSSR